MQPRTYTYKMQAECNADSFPKVSKSFSQCKSYILEQSSIKYHIIQHEYYREMLSS